jgi:hypothetical protein
MAFEPEWPEDARFERRLLATAKADPQPADTQAAWERFAARMGLVVETLRDTADVTGLPPAASRLDARAPAPRGSWGSAVKWLLIGSIGGSVLTAGVLAVRGGEGPQRTIAPTEAPRPPSRPTGGHTDEPSANPPLAAPATRRPPRKTPPHQVVTQQLQREPDPPRSGLAAEVSRLDAARVAIARGDYDDALRLVAGFHDDFPGGALAAEADVVALEALEGKGDHAEVARRAQSFLTKHPNDPHAARVRWLAAQAAAR